MAEFKWGGLADMVEMMIRDHCKRNDIALPEPKADKNS